MTGELIWRQECEHGKAGDCNAVTHVLSGRYCSGGSEVVLEDGEVLAVVEWRDTGGGYLKEITVADVKAELERQQQVATWTEP